MIENYLRLILNNTITTKDNTTYETQILARNDGDDIQYYIVEEHVNQKKSEARTFSRARICKSRAVADKMLIEWINKRAS